MEAQSKHCFEFGHFRLDPAEHTLLHDGHVVPLTPKAFETLLVLIEHHGHLVEKDELLDKVWAGSYVEEANIAKHVSMLRKVLSENGLEEPFIDTVPKHGYRFVAPINEIELESESNEEDRTASVLGNAVGQIKQRKILSFIVIAIFAVGLTAAANYLFLNGTSPVLTDKDVILLADFENKTGEDIFDGTLKQGLMVQLQQSPFLSIFPEQRVRNTLRQMKRPPDGPVTKDIAMEICKRQELKALIAGSIVRLDKKYALTVEAFNARTGETLAIAQIEAAGKDQVLSALSEAASEMRRKLGESLALIERFDKPIAKATTSSLQALQAFSAAQELRVTGKPGKAIALLKRAVEIDPEFAMAYLTLGLLYGETARGDLAIEAIRKAYELREKASEREKVTIEFIYNQSIGNMPASIETLEIGKEMYPRDSGMANDLAYHYNLTGQYEKALTESLEAIKLAPNGALPNANLSNAYIGLGRFEDAKKVIEKERGRGRDNKFWHRDLYSIAFHMKDAESMKRELDWFKGRPDEFWALNLEGLTAAYGGKWKRSRVLFEEALDLAEKSGVKQVSTAFVGLIGLKAAIIEHCDQEDNFFIHPWASCKQLSEEEEILGKMLRNSNKAKQNNGGGDVLYLPMMKAVVELRKGDAGEAIKTLEETRPMEHSPASYFGPQYLRGIAYLRLNQNEKARIEFRKILDRPGESPLSILYPLAQLGMARAQKDRATYEKFFEIWKDADEDLPIMIEARKEYEDLRPKPFVY